MNLDEYKKANEGHPYGEICNTFAEIIIQENYKLRDHLAIAIEALEKVRDEIRSHCTIICADTESICNRALAKIDLKENK